MTTRNAARFAKGSGCYSCTVCGRKTRSTGRGDNENLEQCAECYEAGGLENEIMYNGDPDGKLQAKIDALNAKVIEKGGVL